MNSTDWLALPLFYLLGMVGFFAITLLPYRSFQQILKHSHQLKNRKTWLTSLHFGLILSVIVSCGFFAIEYFLKVCRCLLTAHCSANASGGWIAMAVIGVIYLVFEIIIFLLNWLFNRLSHD